MLNVYYPEIVHQFNMSMEILHWTTQPLFLSEMTTGVYITKRCVQLTSMPVLCGKYFAKDKTREFNEHFLLFIDVKTN